MKFSTVPAFTLAESRASDACCLFLVQKDQTAHATWPSKYSVQGLVAQKRARVAVSSCLSRPRTPLGLVNAVSRGSLDLSCLSRVWVRFAILACSTLKYLIMFWRKCFVLRKGCPSAQHTGPTRWAPSMRTLRVSITYVPGSHPPSLGPRRRRTACGPAWLRADAAHA